MIDTNINNRIKMEKAKIRKSNIEITKLKLRLMIHTLDEMNIIPLLNINVNKI